MAAMHAANAELIGTPASPDGCDGEHARGTCASMPSCAAPVAVPETVVTLVAAVPTADVIPEPVSIHSGPAAGPDVPPPRG